MLKFREFWSSVFVLKLFEQVFDQVKNQNIVVKGVEYDKEVNFLIIELALKDKT